MIVKHFGKSTVSLNAVFFRPFFIEHRMLSIFPNDPSCLTFRLEPADNVSAIILLLRVTAPKMLSVRANHSYALKFNRNQPVPSLPETEIGQLAGIKLGKNIVSIEARISSMLIAPFASSKVKNRFFPRTMPAF